jgi:hypothetical protein
MRRFDENELEYFIRRNKDKFNDEHNPDDNHFDKFMYKLNLRIKHYVSILPYLIKVAIVTVIVFVASIIVWNNYIRKDRHEVTLKQKIENVFTTKRR